MSPRLGWVAVLAILVGCEPVKSAPVESVPVDGDADTDTDTDSDTDSDADDTGTPGTDDTAPPDTGEICGITVPRDTGYVDLGVGEAALTSFDTGNPDFYDTGVGPDCSVSDTVHGYLRLECAPVAWDVEATSGGLSPGRAYWLGDLDNDGYDDFSTEDMNGTNSQLFYGRADLTELGVTTDPTIVADAWNEGTDQQVPYHSSDLTGDGIRDMFIYGYDGVNHWTVIAAGDGTRLGGSVTSFGSEWQRFDYGSATPYISGSAMSNRATRASYNMRWDYDGMDVDGDGLNDTMLGDTFYSGASITAGELDDGSTTVDSWKFYWPPTISSDGKRSYDALQMYYPVGDVDGDGADEVLGLISTYDRDYGVMALFSPADLPHCEFHPNDVMEVEIRESWAWGGGTPASELAVIPAGDINLDGYEDVLKGLGERIYLFYGGETLLTHGGDIGDGTQFPADRIETSEVNLTGEWQAFVSVPQTPDLNGDGASEIVLTGETYDCDYRAFYPISARGRVDIWAGSTAGIRGVNSLDDATLTMVGPPNTCEIYPAFGSGDFDGDGADELMILREPGVAYGTGEGQMWLWPGASLGL